MFVDGLRAGLRRCGCSDRAILVAVSGGADSVALLCGLSRLADEFRLSLTAAHLNHRLRGAAADEDAAWVSRLCERLRLTLILEAADVSEIATKSNRGLEETAREVRYEFLKEAAVRANCSRIAVAHTADDQAETILHHVIRGTGLAGLRGMPRRRALRDDVELIRPLLDITRAEIEAWLAEIGQDYRTDASNLDVQLTRNRIRHRLLTLLRSEFNPHVSEALVRLGNQATETQDAVEYCARALLDKCVLERAENVCRLDCGPLGGAPRHLLRTVLVLLWQNLSWPRQGMGFEHWDRLAEIAEQGGAITLPAGIEARRRGSLLVLQRPRV